MGRAGGDLGWGRGMAGGTGIDSGRRCKHRSSTRRRCIPHSETECAVLMRGFFEYLESRQYAPFSVGGGILLMTLPV